MESGSYFFLVNESRMWNENELLKRSNGTIFFKNRYGEVNYGTQANKTKKRSSPPIAIEADTMGGKKQ